MTSSGICSILFLIFSLIAAPYCFASLPVAHVIVASIWAEQREEYDNKEMQELMIGTVFPDIRYLGELQRVQTHPANVDLNDIIEADTPFAKGVYLHAFLDQQRRLYIEKKQTLSLLSYLLPDLILENPDTFLKLVEDAWLYQEYYDPSWHRLFSRTCPEQIERGSSVYNAMRWNMIVSHYLREGPDRLVWQLSLLGKGFLGCPDYLVTCWSKQLYLAQKTELFKEHTEGLIQHFRTLFMKK